MKVPHARVARLGLVWRGVARTRTPAARGGFRISSSAGTWGRCILPAAPAVYGRAGSMFTHSPNHGDDERHALLF